MSLRAFLDVFRVALSSSLLAAVAVSVLAGVLASAVCPCTLPVGLGVAGVAGTAESTSRTTGLSIAACFFAGIVANLTLLALLPQVASGWSRWSERGRDATKRPARPVARSVARGVRREWS